jgi:hypothetical protein
VTHHNTRSDEVLAIRIDQSGWQKVEIVSNPVCDDSMSSIVSTLGSSAEFHGGAENVDEFSFPLESLKVSIPFFLVNELSRSGCLSMCTE